MSESDLQVSRLILEEDDIIFEGEAGFDDVVLDVEDYNPNHDPETGRFVWGDDDEITIIPPAKDAAPRTLYVYRDVLNAADIIKWAKAQGFETTLPADEMHVTVCYSKTPVDWMKFGQAWDEEIKIVGGPRIVEKLGSAIVLLFGSNSLKWRHEDFKREGASFDYSDFQPHITISYDLEGSPAWEDVEPYQDDIVLGPERFEEINENYKKQIEEV